jgi:hypothetical protein
LRPEVDHEFVLLDSDLHAVLRVRLEVLVLSQEVLLLVGTCDVFGICQHKGIIFALVSVLHAAVLKGQFVNYDLLSFVRHLGLLLVDVLELTMTQNLASRQ